MPARFLPTPPLDVDPVRIAEGPDGYRDPEALVPHQVGVDIGCPDHEVADKHEDQGSGKDEQQTLPGSAATGGCDQTSGLYPKVFVAGNLAS